MNWWKTSLVLRLAGSFFLLSLLVVSLMGVSTYLLARSRLVQTIYSQLALAGEMKMQIFNGWVDIQEQDVQALARLPDFEVHARSLLQNSPDTSDYQASYQALRTAGQIILEEKSDLEEIYFLSAQGGRVIFSTCPEHEGQYQFYENYFQRGLLGPSVQPIYTSSLTLKPAITIAVPLRSADGKTPGVMAANLNLEKMEAIIQDKYGMNEAITTYLVDKNNHLITSGGSGQASDASTIHSAGIDAALNHQDGQGLYENYAGQPVVGVYHAIQDWDMALVTEIDQQAAFAPARSAGWTIFAIGLGLSALLALGVFWIAKRIARPILRITQAADAAAGGDLSSKAPVLTQDEIGDLANAFNTMTARLNSAYQQLRSSEEHFRLLIDNVSDLITIIDPEWIIFYASPSYENVLGYFPSELIGKSLRELLDPQDHERLDNLLHGVILQQPGTAPPFETRLFSRQGQWLNFEVIANNRTESANQGVILVARDITDRKQSEARLYEMNAQLEERVRQRTAELEVANRELEAFSYSVSHDLRTPLRGISGYAQILQNEYADRLDETAHGYLVNILQASQHMSELIYDLLRLARVTRSDLHIRTVDLSRLAENALANLHQRDPQRQVETAIQPDLSVQGDPSLLRILLENLLDNAWKFTCKQPQARIEFGACNEDGQMIYYVKDNGAGFDMRYADKLFGTFERLHQAEEFEGTGIGLATARRIVRRHGGHIWAHSEVGKGAEFYFKLEP